MAARRWAGMPPFLSAAATAERHNRPSVDAMGEEVWLCAGIASPSASAAARQERHMRRTIGAKA